MYANDLKKVLAFMLTNNRPVLVKGAPGVGKTDIITSVCEQLGYDLIISHPVVSDPTDYKGLPFAVNGEAHFLPFGDLKQLMETKKPLVFFLDDLGQATPAVQSAVMQLLLARQINGHKISDEVRFVAATNRRQDKANVSGILEPVKSRFSGGIYELNVSTKDWCEWAWQNGMPSKLISFIEFRPELISDDKFTATYDIENSPSPRTVAGVGVTLTKPNFPTHIQTTIIGGIAGMAFAEEFTAYIKVFAELPTITEIIDDPDGARLPEKISARYAISGAITDAMEDKTIKPLLRYLKRLGNELVISTLVNASMRNPKIQQNSEFIRWATEHSELFTNLS